MKKNSKKTKLIVNNIFLSALSTLKNADLLAKLAQRFVKRDKIKQ